MAFSIKYPEVYDLKLAGDIEFRASEKTTPSANNIYYDIGSVYYIEDPQLNFSDHHDVASAKRFHIMEFANGVKITLRLWIQYYTLSGQAYPAVTGDVCYTDPSNVEHVQQAWSIGGAQEYTTTGLQPGTWVMSYDPARINAGGLKVVLLNEFNNVAVPGVTELTGLRLVLFAPVITTQSPGRGRDFQNIVDGAQRLKYEFEGSYDPVDPDWVFFPSIFKGSSGNSSWGLNTIFYFTSETELVNAVNQNGPDLTLNEITNKRDADEPIQEGDPSKPGGGRGNYDESSDPIDFPALPTAGALSSGAVKAFVMSTQLLTDMFQVLWDASLFDIATQFQKLVTNPLDCIISLHCVPVVPPSSGQGHIMLGSFDTEVTAPYVSNQYVTIDCGKLVVPEFWGSALDYNPYCKVSIYLPFIGIREVNADDIINETIHIKYNFDVFTGDCVAFVKCGKSVLYKFAGEAKQEIPVSATTSNVLYKGLLASVGMAGGMIAGGAVGGAAGAAVGIASAAASVAGSKIVSQRSGALTGNAGLLDDFTPYLIIHRPIQSLARGYNAQKGYTSNLALTLSSCSGYTEVEHIHLTGIDGATDTELQEIESLLKGGVII